MQKEGEEAERWGWTVAELSQTSAFEGADIAAGTTGAGQSNARDEDLGEFQAWRGLPWKGGLRSWRDLKTMVRICRVHHCSTHTVTMVSGALPCARIYKYRSSQVCVQQAAEFYLPLTGCLSHTMHSLCFCTELGKPGSPKTPVAHMYFVQICTSK